MPFTKDTLPTLRDAIADTIRAAIPDLKVWTDRPLDLGRLPAMHFMPPTCERPGVRDRDSELGKADLVVTWPAELFCDDTTKPRGQTEALELLGLLLYAFDAQPTLGNPPGMTVLGCRLVDAVGELVTLSNKADAVLVECTVEAVLLISQ